MLCIGDQAQQIAWRMYNIAVRWSLCAHALQGSSLLCAFQQSEYEPLIQLVGRLVHWQERASLADAVRHLFFVVTDLAAEGIFVPWRGVKVRFCRDVLGASSMQAFSSRLRIVDRWMGMPVVLHTFFSLVQV